MTLWLVKSREDLARGCSCDRALVSFPVQLDCPWCGCGWLFRCMTCRKQFAFANAQEVPFDRQELARLDLGPDAAVADVSAHVANMALFFEHLREGKEYVYLDGSYLPTHATKVQLDGWAARHDLNGVPHVEAVEDPAVLEDSLDNPAYWQRGSATLVR